MPFSLPNLPFNPDALAPWASAETFSFHHGKHHAAYVSKLNAAIQGTNLADRQLHEIIEATRGSNPAVFNNAAQHWNHSFFWECLSPAASEPSGQLEKMLTDTFGSVQTFKDEFGKQALGLFGSGWVWLTLGPEGRPEIAQYKNADTPCATAHRPLLTLDVWEHAYYIDYRNDRAKFIEGFWRHVAWSGVEERLG